MDNYLIEYNNICKLSIRNLLDTIENVDGKKLKNLKVKDLTYHNSKPIWPGVGVYIFRHEKKVVYVGKVSSMSFTERIPKHFDFRHFAWFNRLLELICKETLNLSWNDENAMKASKYAFENLNLVLINFQAIDRINRTERLLRSCLDPLNKFKHLKEKDLTKIVEDY